MKKEVTDEKDICQTADESSCVKKNGLCDNNFDANHLNEKSSSKKGFF